MGVFQCSRWGRFVVDVFTGVLLLAAPGYFLPGEVLAEHWHDLEAGLDFHQVVACMVGSFIFRREHCVWSSSLAVAGSLRFKKVRKANKLVRRVIYLHPGFRIWFTCASLRAEHNAPCMFWWHLSSCLALEVRVLLQEGDSLLHRTTDDYAFVAVSSDAGTLPCM